MFLTVLLSLALLIVLTSILHVNAFVSFLIVAILAGCILGLQPAEIFSAFHKGLGDTVGTLLAIIVLGAMLGKLIAETGAAEQIAATLVRLFGVRYMQWAMTLTGFVVGITLFYGIGFVIVVPLVFSVVFQYKIGAIYIGLPALAALSVTHGYLPPHPAPTALVAQLGADTGKTLLYGLVVAIPAIIVAGPVYARFVKHIPSTPLQTFKPGKIATADLPGPVSSFITALLPVLLLAIATPIGAFYTLEGTGGFLLKMIADPLFALLIALIIGTYLLGFRQKRKMKDISRIYESGIKDVSVIVLVIGGAGALKQIFIQAGIDQQLAQSLSVLQMPPLFLGWFVAAAIRIALGSSTVAGLMTANLIHPLVATTGVDPNLLVLSIGAGSMICAHVNDSGFWLFKEYFNLSLKNTFLTFTVMESLVAVVGLIGILILDQFV